VLGRCGCCAARGSWKADLAVLLLTRRTRLNRVCSAGSGVLACGAQARRWDFEQLAHDRPVRSALLKRRRTRLESHRSDGFSRRDPGPHRAHHLRSWHHVRTGWESGALCSCCCQPVSANGSGLHRSCTGAGRSHRSQGFSVVSHSCRGGVSHHTQSGALLLAVLGVAATGGPPGSKLHLYQQCSLLQTPPEWVRTAAAEKCPERNVAANLLGLGVATTRLAAF
jgi:hypothetical protein